MWRVPDSGSLRTSLPIAVVWTTTEAKTIEENGKDILWERAYGDFGDISDQSLTADRCVRSVQDAKLLNSSPFFEVRQLGPRGKDVFPAK